MKLGGRVVSKFLVEGAEDWEDLERDLAATTFKSHLFGHLFGVVS